MVNTRSLEKFAQMARRQLQEQVANKLARVLATDSAELRGKAQAIQTLQTEIAVSTRAAVVARVAYTWFNRFCALRYMDANHYTRIGAVSPAAGSTQPEILQEAKQGHIDEELPLDGAMVMGLLNGTLPSRDAQQEAYRLLLVATCNSYHTTMPFLFERINDYTELLMPDDLLSTGSILQAVRDALTEEACQDVEVIGWLYQFYIAEKKDEVFAALKQGQKIGAADIPAASQLFTPHWIVRYMVENSLGRLWLLNRPHSKLAERMEFYIAPEEAERDFLVVQSPEEIRLCDPAAGSGHILTYAFDLLYAIYEEEGYSPTDIARLILEKNLYGLEIDERAGALAAFALVMKARARDRRFFGRGVRPHICVLHKIVFSDAELRGEVWVQESGNAKEALLHDLHLFAEADNFGSLLRPHLSAEQMAALRWRMEAKRGSGQANWLEHERRVKIDRALTQAEYLAQAYHVVVANPPYMGGKGMNDRLKEFLGSYYPNEKSDLFSAFIARIMEMSSRGGFIGMMTPFNWMFLSSFEKIRDKILDEATLTNLVQPELHAFFDSAYVSICTFTLFNRVAPGLRGSFINLSDFYGAALQPEKTLEAINNPACGWFHRAAATDFKKIPSSPIAYWVSDRILKIFDNATLLGTIANPCQGVATADNERFVRSWYEVSQGKVGLNIESRDASVRSAKKWFPYNKGGAFRRWYGNQSFVVNWQDDGRELWDFRPRSVIRNPDTFFKDSLSWSKITSGGFSLKYFPAGFIYDVAGCSLFFKTDREKYEVLGAMNSAVMNATTGSLSPTLNFEVGQISAFPVMSPTSEPSDAVCNRVKQLVEYFRDDWDRYEESWNFTSLPLIQHCLPARTLAHAYQELHGDWKTMLLRARELEEENNRTFIHAYGLQDELSPEVPLDEITLTCNPHYRYGGNRSEAELEALLLADTLREFISYAVGCMVGRYSLDKPGLILANQGETLEDYLRQVPHPTYMPDRDNVIPILDDEWFADDIVARFNRFLRVTFGEAHFQENLTFIEKAIGRDLRGYFLRDFYDHHIKLYQKRPIYWLFSSPKGSFNALIYMHRYRPDTVSIVLNDYLREFRTKLIANRGHLQQVTISAAATQRDKIRAIKEIGQIDKMLKELVEYENDVLYPLATQRVEIDLDDGVKVNYNKLGKSLKRVVGLSE